MRQTVAVGVIKATTPKVLEGKQTKAAEKAMKKKWRSDEGQRESTPSTPLAKRKPSATSTTQQPWCIDVHIFIKIPKICLYFHRKEFRRISH